MTSAGVVAELRDLAAEQTLKCWEPRHGDWMRALKKSADLLESQAKALSEAEAEIKKLRARPPLLDAQSLPRVDALVKATEARLAEAMKVIEPFARNVEAMSLGAALGHIERKHLHAARAFTNAAKEKT